MGDIEVFVAPLLESREDIRTVRIARILELPVEMLRVLLVKIRWGQIAPSAEPPRYDWLYAVRAVLRAGYLEVAIVRMDGGCVGIAGMDDEADPRREEGQADRCVEELLGDGRVVRTHLAHGGGRKRPIHDGDVHAGLFEDGGGGGRVGHGEYT